MASQRSPRLPRKPADQYHHGDLQRALLQAAMRTIQKNGVQALSLRAVGEELGVSRSALYRHFTDKAALLAAVAREGFRTLRLELLAAWEGGNKGRAGFDAMGHAYVRFAIQNPWHYRMMFGGSAGPTAPDPRVAEEDTDAFQVLVDALVEQQRLGLVRKDEPQALAQFIWSLVHGIAMLALDGPLQRKQADVEALTRYAIERVHTGIDVAP
jgi:AcrR family transcriptional regulator